MYPSWFKLEFEGSLCLWIASLLWLASFNWHLTLVSVQDPAGLASVLYLCSLYSLAAPKVKTFNAATGLSKRNNKREEERWVKERFYRKDTQLKRVNTWSIRAEKKKNACLWWQRDHKTDRHTGQTTMNIWSKQNVEGKSSCGITGFAHWWIFDHGTLGNVIKMDQGPSQLRGLRRKKRKQSKMKKKNQESTYTK